MKKNKLFTNKKCLFVKSDKSNLPELDYYIKLLNSTKKNIFIEKNFISKLKLYKVYDYIWIPMQRISFISLFYILLHKFRGTKLIIDIRSSSVDPLRELKDLIKILMIFLIKPNYLIFLNESVKRKFASISDFLNCRSFIIDMPISKLLLDRRKLSYEEKKYRILSVIKNMKEFDEYLLIREKFSFSQKINKDVLICPNKEIFRSVKIFISKGDFGIILKHNLDHDDYHYQLRSSLVHFIPYSYKEPFISQTSTRLLDSILNKVFIVTVNTNPNNFYLDTFEYQNYACLYNNVLKLPSKINLKFPDQKLINKQNMKIIQYKLNFDDNLQKIFNIIFD